MRNPLFFIFKNNRKDNCELFRQKSTPQSDDDFINSFCENHTIEYKRVAIIIRNSIAKLGEIENNYVRSDFSFSDLDLLPVWDLDNFRTTQLITNIELELKTNFSEKELELALVRNPDLNPDMRIYEFIDEFYCWYNSLES